MAEHYFGSGDARDEEPRTGGSGRPDQPEADGVIVVTPEQVSKASEPRVPFVVPPFFASRATQAADAEDAVQAEDAPHAEDTAEPDEAERPEAEERPAASPALSRLPGGDDRWHRILSSFVDDPRGAVEAASETLDDEIAAYAAMLRLRKDAILASGHVGQGTSTEDMRVALRGYRDLSRELAANRGPAGTQPANAGPIGAGPVS